jgi:hypothetical protein
MLLDVYYCIVRIRSVSAAIYGMLPGVWAKALHCVHSLLSSDSLVVPMP